MTSTSGTFETLKRSLETEIDPGYLSIPEPVEFPTENGLTAHGFLYLPRNKDFVAPEGELPPLLVQSHGGPTGATSTALSLRSSSGRPVDLLCSTSTTAAAPATAAPIGSG